MCRYHTYPTQYATNLMVAYCVGRIHNMLLDGAHCLGSILWLNRALCRSTMQPVSTYSSHDVRKRNHRIHSMHKQQNDIRSGLFRYFYLKYILPQLCKFTPKLLSKKCPNKTKINRLLTSNISVTSTNWVALVLLHQDNRCVHCVLR